MKRLTQTVWKAIGLSCALVLTGCATQPTDQQAGTALGAVLGGVLGSQVGQGNGRTAATIAGTMAGAMVGSSIGQHMDQVDRMKRQRALERDRTGRASHWRDPDTGAQYTVRPVRTYRAASGRVCRAFTQSVDIHGRLQTAHGTACRQADGTWQIRS